MNVMQLATKYSRKILWVLLGLIIFYGAFFRLSHLGYQSLWIDEVFTIQAAQGVQKTGIPILPSDIVYTAHPISIYITAFSQELFGFNAMNPWQARIPHVLFGIASILLFAYIAYTISKNLWITVLATFVFTFFEWHLAWSRQSRGYTLMQFFLLWSYLFMYKNLITQKIKYWITSALSLILAILSQGIAMVVLPMLFINPILHLTDTNYDKNKKIYTIIAIIVSIIVSIIAYTLWVPHITFNSYHMMYLEFLLRLFLPLGILILFGMIIMGIRKKINQHIFVSLGWIIIPGFIIVWFSPVFQLRYLLVITPFIFIILIHIINYFLKEKNNLLRILSLVFGMICFGIFMFYHGIFIPQKEYILEFGSPQPLFKEAYQIILDEQKRTGLQKNTIISTHPSVTRMYLGEPGLWIPISLTGKPEEIPARTLDNQYEYYTRALIITNPEELQKIIDVQSGYIILDTMSLGRLSREWLATIENHPRITTLFKKTFYHDTVFVFSF